jgi:Fe-S-cluster containining protein
MDHEPWWGDGLYFSCVQCGKCCGEAPGTVSFTADEELAMAEALGIGVGDFRSLYVWRRYGSPSLRERANYDCVFFDAGTHCCAIYDARPSQCSEFPFWPDILQSRESWDRFALACPGMNHGGIHDDMEIRSRLYRQIKHIL